MAPSILARVNGLPPELRKLIAKRHFDEFGRGIAAELSGAHCLLTTKRVLKNLRYVIVVKRHTSVPEEAVLGAYFGGGFSLQDLTATRSTVVRSKRPVRCSLALYRVDPLAGPWRKRGDSKTPKAVLVPVRVASGIVGGKTTDEARQQLQRMVTSLFVHAGRRVYSRVLGHM